MIKTEQNLGVSGEFRVIVRRSDGSVKLDTGVQSNLLLDNGIKHFLGLPMVNSAGKQQPEHRGSDMRICYVGTGNTPPQESDVALQNFVAKNAASKDWVSGVEHPREGLHEGFVKLWIRGKHIFDTIKDKNVTEVGLVAWEGTENIDGTQYKDVYSLVTRALIKDTSGVPIAVTVLEDEILEVVYQLNMYIDIRRQTGEFNVTTTKDGSDVVEVFEYFLQPHGVTSAPNYLGQTLGFNTRNDGIEAWGVKETDEELTADYDLNDEAYVSLVYSDTSRLGEKVSGNTRSGRQYYVSNKYATDYLLTSVVERSYATRRITYKHVNGVYTHVHTNGIRAYEVGVGMGSYYRLFGGLVVVKNKANGQGIKKTDRQLWEFEHSFTVNRWGG